MLYYLKKYPFSSFLILTVIYLSFFKPPTFSEPPLFPYFDKLVHFCMYGGLSGMLWLEFLRNHRHSDTPNFMHAWIGATLCPILLSAGIELGQEYLTSYRGGEWADLLANNSGVVYATHISYYLLRPAILKKS